MQNILNWELNVGLMICINLYVWAYSELDHDADYS